MLKSEFEKVKQEKEGIEFKIEKFDNASKTLDKLIGSQITNNSKKGLGYHAVPPPYPLIYNGPTKLDLSYSGIDEFKEPEFKGYGPRDSKLESNINHDQKSDDSKENSDDSFVKEQVSEDTSSFVKSPLNGKPQNDDKGFIDSGCSRHMTENIAYLLDFKEFDEGYVTFGGGAHGGRISGKEDGKMKVTATIDGRIKTITEASIRRHLKLEDSDGITTLPNAEIFEQLALMGVEDLQSNLQQTKLTYAAAYTKLILRVKKLEHKVKTRQHRRRERVVLSDDDEDLEDPFKQERKIDEIDKNPSISLPTELVKDLGSGEKGEKEISTVIHEVSTAAENLVYIRRSAEKRKDKGKAIMKEDKSVQRKSKKQLEQERLGHEEAIRLQEQIFKEKRQRIDRDAEIAKQLQEAIAEADSAHDIDWNDSAVLRYHALQNRSFSVAEVRKNMCMHLKNRGGYKQSHFKRMSYEDIRLIFERVWDQIHAFVLMDSEIKKEVIKKSRFDLQQKQFAEEVSEKKDGSSSKPVGGKEEATTEYEKEKEKLRLSLKIIHNDDSEVNYEPLFRKFPIVSWEYQLLGKMEAKDMEVCKLTRADRNLRMIFDLDENDELWMNQLDWKLLRWKLHENCGVHTLFMDGALMEINMLVEKKYPLIKELLKKMLNLQLEAEEESTMAFELSKLIKSLLEE
nr:hypothetical protein [Tanacetum cinerariifolium]